MGVSQKVHMWSWGLGVLILNIYMLLDVSNSGRVCTLAPTNVVLRTVLSCVVNSQDFNQFCYLYGVSVMCMNFSELTCAVYE